MTTFRPIGCAVDTPNGLVDPFIRDANHKVRMALSKELAEISAKAREKKLGPADMSGGCFSISSLGGIGGTAFTPIINAPEVALLGVSKAQTKPLCHGKAFAPTLMRLEERRVGQECGSTCRSRRWPYHIKKKQIN